MRVRFSQMVGWPRIPSVVAAAVAVILSSTLTLSPVLVHFHDAIDPPVMKVVLIASAAEQVDDEAAVLGKRHADTSDWGGPGNGWG